MIRGSKRAEADQIVKAMTDKNIPVTYVLYPDEGHGFHRPENNKSFNAVTEAFLAEQLGGPLRNRLATTSKGANITVPHRRRARARPSPKLSLRFQKPKPSQLPREKKDRKSKLKANTESSLPAIPLASPQLPAP